MIIVQIAGRLGKDPESRFTPSGQKVTTLTLATNVRKAGKDETVWWRVTIWGDRFDKMMPYVKKGTALIVIGDMNKPEIWTDKESRPQVSMEVTADIIRFSPFGNGTTQEGGASNQSTQSQSGYAPQSNSQPQSSYGQAAQSNYGSDNSDFNGSMQGGSSRYSHSENEDPIPF